jgi:hypothetical protein
LAAVDRRITTWLRGVVQFIAAHPSNDWVGVVTDPAVALFLLAWDVLVLDTAPHVALPCVAIGAVAWTIAEYAAHRWLYHARMPLWRVGHEMHHESPELLIGLPWFATAGLVGACLSEVHHDVERVLRDPGQVRELVEHMLDLHPRRRGPGDGRQEDPAVGDAHREGEPRLEGLHDQLAVVLFLDSPVVPRGKLKIQQTDPLQRKKIKRDRDKTRHRSVGLTLDSLSRPRRSTWSSTPLCGDGISVPDHWVWIAALPPVRPPPPSSGGHGDLLQEFKFIENPPDSQGHAGHRVLGDRHGKLGLPPEQPVQPA